MKERVDHQTDRNHFAITERGRRAAPSPRAKLDLQNLVGIVHQYKPDGQNVSPLGFGDKISQAGQGVVSFVGVVTQRMTSWPPFFNSLETPN